MNFQTKCTSCNSCSFSVTSSSLSGSASSINRWASFCLSAPCGSSGSRGTWPNNSFKFDRRSWQNFLLEKETLLFFGRTVFFGQELFTSVIWGIRCRKFAAEITLHRSWKTAPCACKLLSAPKSHSDQKISDQFRFSGNYPPTPPLIQHFALSEK